MPSKRVRIHYRRYMRGSEPAIAELLAPSIVAALACQIEGVALNDDARLREYSDEDQGTIILNGRFATKSGDVLGELVRFQPDTNIPLLMQNSASRAELEIRELAKPNDSEFLRGMIFFLVRGDHVFVIEQDLGNPALERYLRWILCEQCRVAQRSARIALIPKLFLDDNAEMVRDVREIHLRPAKLAPNRLDLGDRPQRQASIGVTPETDVLGLLGAAGFDTAVLERIMQRHNAAVELNLTVKLKSGRTSATIQGDEAIALLRNVPEDDLIVDGASMRKNRGVLERLSEKVDIERKGNILVRQDAWQALQAAAAAYGDAGWI